MSTTIKTVTLWRPVSVDLDVDGNITGVNLADPLGEWRSLSAAAWPELGEYRPIREETFEGRRLQARKLESGRISCRRHFIWLELKEVRA